VPRKMIPEVLRRVAEADPPLSLNRYDRFDFSGDANSAGVARGLPTKRLVAARPQGAFG